MNISEASKRSGLPVKTIRYYEEIGLVFPERQANGYRNFGRNDVHNLTFLGHARDLGFSIQDCRDLLRLYQDRDRTSAEVRAIAQNHLSQITRRIEQLHDLQRTLRQLVDACAGDDRPDCPILTGLSEPAQDQDH